MRIGDRVEASFIGHNVVGVLEESRPSILGSGTINLVRLDVPVTIFGRVHETVCVSERNIKFLGE